MSSFVFNDFKKRYLNGEVPSADEWTFIPVSDTFKDHFEFDDIRLDHYRTLSDFKDVDKTLENTYFTYEGTRIGTHSKEYPDLVEVSGANFKLAGLDLIEGEKLTYTWTKVLDDDDLSNKPMYITNDNFPIFKSYYNEAIANNGNIQNYLSSGGFYFIRSKDELEWFAEHANTNNKIIGVMGDNIEGVIAKPIGYDEKVPFNGIFDGNYYTFDITIKANYTDNGIVGVLGPEGIVRNIKLSHSAYKVSIDCENMPITLEHIKNDGRDVNCGMVVGRNYGKVENIDATTLDKFDIYGCVPGVYSVTNKSDDIKWNEKEKIVRKKFDENNSNFFYLNSFCINSPGNICPYVGYFNEGKFMDDAATLLTDLSRPHFGNSTQTEPSIMMYYYMGNWGKYMNEASPEGVPNNRGFFRNYGDNGIDPTFRILSATDIKWEEFDPIRNQYITYSTSGFQMQYYTLGSFWATTRKYNFGDYGDKSTLNSHEIVTPDELEKEKQRYLLNPLYYGMDNFGFFTVRGVGNGNISAFSSTEADKDTFSAQTATYVENYNSNLCQKALGNSGYRDNWDLEPSYEATRCSMRPHPMARAAYNVGTIIGANYGTAQQIDVSAIVRNTSNFVGFIGGLIGKQAYGVINWANVYMDNQFVYQLSMNTDEGKTRLDGSVVYYKQTPILPDKVKTYIQGQLNQSIYNDDALSAAKTTLIETFCEPYYDNNRLENVGKYSVNTATTITDDVMAYELRPIFVVGGLFGRLAPSFGTKDSMWEDTTGVHWESLNTIVNQASVFYKDNYSTTSGLIKRPENAFGAVIGKVDYSTVSNTVSAIPSMALNMCQIKTLSEVGEPVRVFGNSFDETQGEFVPIVSAVPGTDNLSGLNSAMSTRRYVGIYEIKNNVLDPVSYDTNSAMTADINGNYVGGTKEAPTYTPTNKSLQSVSTMGIYYAGDYPIDLSSHNGGIEMAHVMFTYQQPNDDYYWSAHIDPDDPTSKIEKKGPWDIRHVHYTYPNFVPTNNTGGFNKRNIASNIILMNNCSSNVENWIQLYDDYINNWKYMQLPPSGVKSTEQGDPTELSDEHLSANTFNAKELYIIQKYWNRIGTNYCGFNFNKDRISANLHWDSTKADFNKNINYYTQGLLAEQIDFNVYQGSQNTFDGYTTVDILVPCHYSKCLNYPDDSPSDLYAGQYNTPWRVASARNSYIQDTNEYLIPKTYRKNILTHFNSNWHVEATDNFNFVPSATMYNRSKLDTYFYYTYTTEESERNKIFTVPCTKEKAFAFTLPITFTADKNRFGYTTPLTKDEYEYRNEGIILGEYFTPAAIRDKINKSTTYNEKGQQYFITTAVSASNKFGGLLVVDSSGHNVMFMDNENKQPLTGNSVKYLTHTLALKNNKTAKIVLEVE